MITKVQSFMQRMLLLKVKSADILFLIEDI